MNTGSLRAAIAIATALNVWVAPLAAQDTPVAFVHGLNSSGITWQSMRSSLDAELAINHVSPNLSSFQVYSTQADALHTKLVASFPSNSPVVAVTHSNGGVVTRRYLTTHATPYIDRHLSIGSPHYGAPLAQRVLTGQVTSWAEDIFYKMAEAFAFYDENDSLDFPFLVGGAAAAAGAIAWSLGYVDIAVTTLGFISPALGSVPPVLSQMVPGSSFLVNQNASAALQTEASRTTARISISTEQKGSNQPYALFWTNDAEMKTTVIALIGFADAMYAHYSNHPDPYLQSHAYLWFLMADELAMVQIRWFHMNGTLEAWVPYFYWIAKSDGIVPWASSAYPGGDHFEMNRSAFGDIMHSKQTSSIAVTETVSVLLRTQMGVELDPPPGGGGPTPPSISGPSMVQPDATCNYFASASHGSAPYTFDWHVNGSFIGSGESMPVYISAPGITLSLTAYDAFGVPATNALTISTNSGASPCFDQ